MPWMSSNLNFLLASPLASVRCNSLGSRLSPWQVLLATVAFVPSISDALAYSGIPGPSEMWRLPPDEDCDEEPLKGLASLESTTPSNMSNLQKKHKD
jgi:hypothetical protein